MKQPRLPTSQETDAFLAPILALLACLFSLIGKPRREIRRAIERAEHAVECFIFLKAVARVTPPTRRARRPLNAPSGFRRAMRHRRMLFRYGGIARRRAGFVQRIARLIAVLANPERYIARFAALLARGLRPGALIAAAPPACAFASACARALEAVDSS